MKLIESNKFKEEIDDLIDKSDKALSYAKFMGRNRVKIFREYLKEEMENLGLVRHFYFHYSHKAPSLLREVFNDKYLINNPKIKNKLKRHFDIIRIEIDPRDTRTQAVFADGFYKIVVNESKAKKQKFLNFLNKYVNVAH